MLYNKKTTMLPYKHPEHAAKQQKIGYRTKISLSIVIIGIQFATSETSKGVQNAAARAVQ